MLRVNVEEVLTLVVGAAAKLWAQWILYPERMWFIHRYGHLVQECFQPSTPVVTALQLLRELAPHPRGARW